MVAGYTNQEAKIEIKIKHACCSLPAGSPEHERLCFIQ